MYCVICWLLFFVVNRPIWYKKAFVFKNVKNANVKNINIKAYKIDYCFWFENTDNSIFSDINVKGNFSQ